jgi:DNA polymerase-3 subunit alpha
MIQFVEKNVKKYPGKSALKFHINEPSEFITVTLRTFDSGFEMNEEMAQYLQLQPDWGVHVSIVGQ